VQRRVPRAVRADDVAEVDAEADAALWLFQPASRTHARGEDGEAVAMTPKENRGALLTDCCHSICRTHHWNEGC
jgi:hypothetical protein